MPVGVGTAIIIAEQVCDGLAEAHRHGTVHRDLKPSNIMVDREGNFRIMDFGIARSMRAKSMTGAGTIIGTPEYMSPEQVEGKEVDLRSDIYSLGVILYEMLTGRAPFEADTPFAVGMKHKSEIPRDPREFDPQIPEGLSRLVPRRQGDCLLILEKGESGSYADEGRRKQIPGIDRRPGLMTRPDNPAAPNSRPTGSVFISPWQNTKAISGSESCRSTNTASQSIWGVRLPCGLLPKRQRKSS